MKNLDGDAKLKYLAEKINKGEHLTNEDILNLTLVPLISGKESRSERTIKSIELAENISEDTEKLQCLSLLYALFEKFGDSYSKKKFMGVISMTEIGRMLREEGVEEGRVKGRAEGKAEGMAEGKEEGKAEGKAEILIKQLIKKFTTVPKEYRENIKKLPEETIDVIAIEIFDLKDIKELEKYLE